MAQRLQLKNRVFDRLTVLEFEGISTHGKTTWLCRCDCPKKTELVVIGDNLTSGNTTSCGCASYEKSLTLHKTHGHTSNGKVSPTYGSWYAMIKRCTYAKDNHYKDYGARGIVVCDRWLLSFENFLADMGARPLNRTLDRIDNNGNYEPDNCKWATTREQRLNQRKKRAIENFQSDEFLQEAVRRGYNLELAVPEYGMSGC